VTRRALIAGNWKMHKTPQETEVFIAAFLERDIPMACEILLLPPFTSLERASRLLAETGVSLGAQDLHQEPRGAFTGAVSGDMIRESGCRYVLVGHSERRHVFGDDDEVVRRKLRAALVAGLAPILCVGETLEERRSGETSAVIARQLATALGGVPPDEMARTAIAYEPVWAIGTGETATPAQAQDAIAGIRRSIAGRFGEALGRSTRILYGGSVKPENAAEILRQPDVDGALVGGASLDPEGFARIAEATEAR
jgi:triosephosphate isomerase